MNSISISTYHGSKTVTRGFSGRSSNLAVSDTRRAPQFQRATSEVPSSHICPAAATLDIVDKHALVLSPGAHY